MWNGVEQSDSIVFDPPKWLGASFDCSAYFVRDPAHLLRVMSTDAAYLRPPANSQVKCFRDWGIPLTRQYRGLDEMDAALF